MAWYKTGTINLTNGSATVYGNGTLWVDAAILNAGDLLIGPDGKLYEIGSFQSNTQLTLTTGYLGSTGATQPYSIVPIGLLPSALAQQVKTTLSTANTALSQVVRFDAVQNLTAPQQATARSNIGALAGTDVGLGLLSKSVAGNVNVTLTGVEAAALFYEFTGTLTGNINVIVPASVRQFYVRNATTGAYTLTVKTAAGTGVAVLQGTREILECDGTTVLRPTSIDAVITATAGGSVGIGTSAPAEKLHVEGIAFVNSPAGNVATFKSTTADGAYVTFKNNGTTLGYIGAGRQLVNGGGLQDMTVRSDSGNILFSIGGGDVGRIDSTGNLLVGATSGLTHLILKNVAEGADVAYLGGTASTPSLGIKAVTNIAWNNAQSAIIVGKISTTSRSINAAGTVNASGADYAEYMTKADDCGSVSKGQIIGVDAAGKLVDKWSMAMSFRIKSTDPSYVGGDTWGSADALGVARPPQPLFEQPTYTGNPIPIPLGPEATDEDRVAYAAQLRQYDADQAEYAQSLAKAKLRFDNVVVPAYEAELAAYEEKLEAARQRVDRIAFCGQVPVNVTGAVPGQYVVPVQDGTGIGAVLMNEADITFEQYRRAVGRVQNILPDGRANVVVKVV